MPWDDNAAVEGTMVVVALVLLAALLTVPLWLWWVL